MTKPFLFSKAETSQDWTCKCLCSYNLGKHLLPLCGKCSPFRTVSLISRKDKSGRTFLFWMCLITGGNFRQLGFLNIWKMGYFFLNKFTRKNQQGSWKRRTRFSIPVPSPSLPHLFLDSSRSCSGPESHLHCHLQILGCSFSGLGGLGSGLVAGWATFL